MANKCGIVGLPNVGKSTLFNIIVGKEQAEVADYPFCTIEPNRAHVLVKDHRLNYLEKIEKSQKTIFSTMELYDIAGLVKGASQGEGLGNQFLGNILEVDVIIHVVRLFESDSLEEDYDPIESFETIKWEMVLWDLQRLESKINSNKKNDDIEELKQIHQCLKNSLLPKSNKCNFPILSTKPVLILGNGTTKKLVEKIENYSKEKGYKFINFNFHQLEEENIQNLILQSYQSLDLVNFFTCGPKEARSWTVKKNSTYRSAAGAIHSDIEKSFICAQVIPWHEYKKKPMVMKKANEILQEGDVVIFKHH